MPFRIYVKLYTYVNNNPLNYIDPDGRFGVAAVGAAVGVTAVVAATIYANNPAVQDAWANIYNAVTGNNNSADNKTDHTIDREQAR